MLNQEIKHKINHFFSSFFFFFLNNINILKETDIFTQGRDPGYKHKPKTIEKSMEEKIKIVCISLYI